VNLASLVLAAVASLVVLLADKVVNVPFYPKFGFDVVGEELDMGGAELVYEATACGDVKLCVRGHSASENVAHEEAR